MAKTTLVAIALCVALFIISAEAKKYRSRSASSVLSRHARSAVQSGNEQTAHCTNGHRCRTLKQMNDVKKERKAKLGKKAKKLIVKKKKRADKLSKKNDRVDKLPKKNDRADKLPKKMDRSKHTSTLSLIHDIPAQRNDVADNLLPVTYTTPTSTTVTIVLVLCVIVLWVLKRKFSMIKAKLSYSYGKGPILKMVKQFSFFFVLLF